MRGIIIATALHQITSHESLTKDNQDFFLSFRLTDLFKLKEMAFAVEISIAKARKEDSRVIIRNKEELLHALTDMEIFAKIIEEATEADEISEDIRKYLRETRAYMVDYFMKIKDLVNLGELRFY